MERNIPVDTYLALLRGINVGGKNRLSMTDLSRIVALAGGTDVRTYIQSGNVVFRAEADLSAAISRGLQEALGLSVPVVLRTHAELAAVVAKNPFLAQGADPDALNAMFLADWPEEEAVRALDPERSPGDAYVVVGREVYMHCPKGLARCKLTNDYFDRRLKTTSTVRNWRTVLKLLELADAAR